MFQQRRTAAVMRTFPPHTTPFSGFFFSSCFQIPVGRRAEREEALAVVDGAETATTGLGLVLSSVGLRAGIQAPPELAQAVLEGVFWCRCGRLLFGICGVILPLMLGWFCHRW